MIKILDVCSGIGGFSLGLEATGGFDTVAFCEYDEFCRKVLNKHWPDVPIYKDLKEIGNEPTRLIQEFDLICGGIPCQPFSLAGKQKGKEDDRHLWPYMYEIIKHKKPTWVIVENVGGFVNVALDDVCLDLEAEGYATQSFIIPACGVEAPHRRDRIWIIGKNVGNTTDNGRSESKPSEEEGRVIGQSEEGRVLESKGASDGGASDVDDSKRNEHIEEIRGGDGEEREDEKRQGEEDSTSRISSGASGLRVSDQGHETSGYVADTEFKGLQGGERNSQGEGRKVLSPEQHNRDEVRSETRRISGVSGETENVADSKGKQRQRELRDGKQKNGEKKKRGKSDRRGSQPSNRSTDDRRTEDVADSSSKGSQGHRGEHGLRETSEEEQAVRGSEERDVSHTESIGSSSDNNNGSSIESSGEDRIQSESRRERSSKGTTEDVSNSGGERGRSGQTDRQNAKDARELTGSQEHREGNAESRLGGMVDGLSSRLDGHHGFEVEPDIPRVAENIPDRVNRLKALGNSIVPQIIYHIGMAILEEERK